MAIAYPLNTPTNIGIASITFTAENAVAISQSPFTYAQQVVSHPGQRWGASISLPPMKRQDAEYWVAFLLSLKGQAGTFLLSDPNCPLPQGFLGNNSDWFLAGDVWNSLGVWVDFISWPSPPTTGFFANPLVNGNQTSGSSTINLKGFAANISDWLLPGDYLQFGSASSATLHKVLTPASSNSLGNITVDIWPNIKRNLVDGEVVTFENAKGRFRLKENMTQWQINDISSYGITFDCVEAI